MRTSFFLVWLVITFLLTVTRSFEDEVRADSSLAHALSTIQDELVNVSSHSDANLALDDALRREQEELARREEAREARAAQDAPDRRSRGAEARPPEVQRAGVRSRQGRGGDAGPARADGEPSARRRLVRGGVRGGGASREGSHTAA